MKRLMVFSMLLFAGAAAAAPPAASSRGETPQTAEAAAHSGAAQAARGAAQASEEAAREAADARELARMQERMNELAQRMAELSVKIGDQASASALRYLADSKRGMLGVVLDDDPAGARVSAVTPNGPAERAGIRDGDVITAIDGAPMRKGGDLALGSRLIVDKPVTLSVLRDGKTRQVRVTPERFQAAEWRVLARTAQAAAQRSAAEINSPEFRKKLDRSIEEAVKQSEKARAQIAAHWGDHFEFNGRWFAPWWGLNLASLNPELGGYFGAAHGALVLSTDAKRYPGLQAGDVITGVNGRAVSTPEEAMRALQSPSADKPVRLQVLRHGKQVAVEMKPPQRWELLPPAPPAPPAPLAPVATPAPQAAPAPTTPAAPAAPPAPPPPRKH